MQMKQYEAHKTPHQAQITYFKGASPTKDCNKDAPHGQHPGGPLILAKTKQHSPSITPQSKKLFGSPDENINQEFVSSLPQNLLSSKRKSWNKTLKHSDNSKYGANETTSQINQGDKTDKEERTQSFDMSFNRDDRKDFHLGLL